jgi:hypothetical protein
MSWDVFVQDLPPDARAVADIPHDFRPGAIGRRSEVIEAIQQVVPDADFSDPSWGKIDRDSFAIEVNLGQDERVSSFVFHVRGSGNAPQLIDAVLESLELRAIDSGTGEIFSLEAAVRSFREWNDYRDGVMDAGDHGKH